MEHGTWYQVTVRIAADLLSPGEISRLLELTATTTRRKGECVDAISDGSRYGTNLWIMSGTVDERVPFEDQMAPLLDTLEERAEALTALLSLPGVEGELLLGFGGPGTEGSVCFSPSLLRRIGALGLSIQLDLYPVPGL